MWTDFQFLMNVFPCSFSSSFLPVFLLPELSYNYMHTVVFCPTSASPSSSLSHVSAPGLVLNLISPALLMYTISSRVHLLSPAIFLIHFPVRDCRLWSAPNFHSTVCSVIYSIFSKLQRWGEHTLHSTSSYCFTLQCLDFRFSSRHVICGQSTSSTWSFSGTDIRVERLKRHTSVWIMTIAGEIWRNLKVWH